MPCIIDEVSIEGFRGINNKLTLKLPTEVCLLYGRNGSGKTSVLQAIEWCITDTLPYLSGPEFGLEDAIVNLFHPGKGAVVSIKLRDETGETILVTRRRKMYKTTTRGRSQLELKTERETLTDEEAQSRLNQVLGMKPEDFPKITYLHQESIRDLLTADPKERSRTINRLLGTFELAELAEALDVSRKIRAEKKKLNAHVEMLEKEKIAFVVRMRQRLNQERGGLLKKGYSDAELDIKNVAQKISGIIENLEAIAVRLGAPAPSIAAPELESKSISEKIAEAENQLTTLDRFRSAAYRVQEQRRLNLETMRKQYQQAEKEVLDLGAVTPEDLEERKKEAKEQLEQVQRALETLQARMRKLGVAKPRLESALKQIDAYKQQLVEIENVHGDEQRHLKQIEELKSTAAELMAESKRFASLAQIISLAIDYLNESKPDECPICGQAVEYQKVVSRLQTDTRILVSEKIKELREKEGEVRKRIGEIEKSLERFRDIKSRLEVETTNFQEVKKEIESIIGEEVDKTFDIDQKIKEAEEEALALDAKRTRLTKSIFELEQKYNTLTSRLRGLEQIQVTIQRTIDSDQVGKNLIRNLEEEIKKASDLSKSYEDTAEIDSAARQLLIAKELVQYLGGKEELDELEKQLPQATKLVEDLKARIVELSILEGSLDAIRQVTLAHQQDIVTTTLGSLEASINHYFSSILAHPYFAKLRLEPEEKKPLIYSIKGLSADLTLSTYIPTRFSNTQMNVVALSLFMSNNTEIANNLAVMIMDDPTQNMDQEHKEALSTIIQELSMKRQAIIATHDSELKDALNKTCKKLHTYEFTEWNTEGPQIRSL